MTNTNQSNADIEIEESLIVEDDDNEKLVSSDLEKPQWLLRRYHDKSYINMSLLRGKERRFIKYIESFSGKYSCYHPQSKFLLLWNFLVVMSIGYNCYQIPISLCFTDAVYTSQFESAWVIILNVIFLLIIFVNLIIIRPFTQFYDQGVLITSNKKILKKYVKLQFWLNLLSFLSLLVYIASGQRNTIYGKLGFFYLSIFGLIKINGLICQKIFLMKIRYIVYRLLRCIILLFFVIVWIASIYFSIDYYFYTTKHEYYYNGNLWLTNSACCMKNGGEYIDMIQEYQWHIWVTYALYWMLQSVSLVGYGDITPRNPYEVVYCDVVIVALTFIYAYFINTVWKIMAQFLVQKQLKYKKMLKIYQKHYGIGDETVIKYTNLIHESIKLKQNEESEQQILQSLSPELRDQFLLQRQKQCYQKIPLFQRILQFGEGFDQVFYQLALVSKQNRYGENQCIYQEKQIANSLFYIALGEVQLRYENSSLVKIAKIGHFFGVADFLYKSYYHYSTKTLKFCKITQLSSQNLKKALQKIPYIYQKYMQLYDEIKIYQKYQLTGEQCWSCGGEMHAITSCPDFFQWLINARNIEQKFEEFTVVDKKCEYRKVVTRRSMKSEKIYIWNREDVKKNIKNHTVSHKYPVDKIKIFKIYQPQNNF